MSAGFERFASAVLDHAAAGCGYRAFAEARPAAGAAWRRAYVRDGGGDRLTVVGPDAGTWVSVGIEIPCPRRLVEGALPAVVGRLAPYEVAIDPDAGADAAAPDAVLRLALRLFPEGLTAVVFRDAAETLIEAASEARRELLDLSRGGGPR